MFDKLSDRLGGVFDRLRGRGALNEADVREAMREVRVALLEADVALTVVREFIDKVTEQVVERAAEIVDKDEADKLAAKMAKGQFDMNDLRTQFRQMTKMGGLGALAGMLPGMKKAKAAMDAGGMNDKLLVHMDAIIGSMTPKERAKPELLNAKRKIRIAKGSGTTVQDVNKLIKMHQEMASAMKRIRKMGGLKGLAAMFGKGGGDLGGAMEGMHGLPSGSLPSAMGGLPGMGGGGMPPDLARLLSKKK